MLARAGLRCALYLRPFSSSALPPLPPEVAQQLAASPHSVVVFTRSYCPACKDLVERMDDANVPTVEVALEGDATRDALRAATKQHSVPFVFMGGVHIDSTLFIAAMKKPGDAAAALFAAHGVARTGGYFRP